MSDPTIWQQSMGFDRAGEQAWKFLGKEMVRGQAGPVRRQLAEMGHTVREFARKDPRGAAFLSAWWAVQNHGPVGLVRRALGFRNPYQRMLHEVEHGKDLTMGQSLRSYTETILDITERAKPGAASTLVKVVGLAYERALQPGAADVAARVTADAKLQDLFTGGVQQAAARRPEIERIISESFANGDRNALSIAAKLATDKRLKALMVDGGQLADVQNRLFQSVGSAVQRQAIDPQRLVRLVREDPEIRALVPGGLSMEEDILPLWSQVKELTTGWRQLEQGLADEGIIANASEIENYLPVMFRRRDQSAGVAQARGAFEPPALEHRTFSYPEHRHAQAGKLAAILDVPIEAAEHLVDTNVSTLITDLQAQLKLRAIAHVRMMARGSLLRQMRSMGISIDEVRPRSGFVRGDGMPPRPDVPATASADGRVADAIQQAYERGDLAEFACTGSRTSLI